MYAPAIHSPIQLSALMLAILPIASADAWETVANNGDFAPGSTTELFFSYNQPSIDDAGLVVFRARAKTPSGGTSKGEPLSGIFTRDMSVDGATIEALAVRKGELPAPNNVTTPGPSTFNEFPSFPRIDATSGTVAFRAQSTPSLVTTLPDGSETRSGTSGLYATPASGSLIAGIRNVLPGSYPEFQVPNQQTAIRFDQFPGAPSPTGNIITFKGNWTDSNGANQTGVYFRDIVANGGSSPVIEVARRGMAIPSNAIPENYAGTGVFDSTSPPSAAAGKIVFTGLDNEAAPKAGGIFMASLTDNPTLSTVASINTQVPKNGTQTLTAFGEGLSFDGRYVGFWGGWGTETFSKQLQCASDGSAALLSACYAQDDNGIANDGIYNFDVLKNQGIFLADTQLDKIFLVAQTGGVFDDFLFWNFSGKASGEEGDAEAEAARWRSSAFVAIDGNDVIFKAMKGAASGLYSALDVSDMFNDSDLVTLLETGMDGGMLDPMAAGLPIVSLGIERDGFRNGKLAINASMATAEEGWAGIYVTSDDVRAEILAMSIPEPGTLAQLGLGLAALTYLRLRRDMALIRQRSYRR